MARRRRSRRRTLTLVKPASSIGFTPDLQHVLNAAARTVARELGRQAAREAFEKMKTKVS